MLFVCAGTELPATDKSADLIALARSMVSKGAATQLTQESFNGFIRKLRRTLPYYLFRMATMRRPPRPSASCSGRTTRARPISSRATSIRRWSGSWCGRWRARASIPIW